MDLGEKNQRVFTLLSFNDNELNFPFLIVIAWVSEKQTLRLWDTQRETLVGHVLRSNICLEERRKKWGRDCKVMPSQQRPETLYGALELGWACRSAVCARAPWPTWPWVELTLHLFPTSVNDIMLIPWIWRWV